MLFNEENVPLLVTHNGVFHADEVFGYCVIRVALGLVEGNHCFIRTRDTDLIQAADIVWDVGGRLDPSSCRFDHHMRDRPLRPDGSPISSAGLLWREYGMAAVRSLILAQLARRSVGLPADIDIVSKSVFDRIEESVVARIDAIDNGVSPGSSFDLSTLVDDCNLTWDTSGGNLAEDAAFMTAVRAVDGYIDRRVDNIRAMEMAKEAVLSAHASSEDPRILELPMGMPWFEAAFDAELPILYAVYPLPSGSWMIRAMPTIADSFDQRLPFPEAWAGLRDGDLAESIGIPGAVFVHPSRFIGGAASKEGVMEMARRSIAIGYGIDRAESVTP